VEDTMPTDLISASDYLARHAKRTCEVGMAIKSHLTNLTRMAKLEPRIYGRRHWSAKAASTR